MASAKSVGKDEEEEENWRMAVAIRVVTPSDRTIVKCQTAIVGGGPANHVELLFRVPCEGPGKCPCHRVYTFNGNDPNIHKHGRSHHIVSYAIRDVDDEDRYVKMTVESTFKREYGWVYIDVHATEKQQQSALEFCKNAEGSPYNTCGSHFNWICKYCTGMYIGTRNEEVHPESKWRPKTLSKRSWYCSEFIYATLIWCGVIKDKSVEPANTMPQDLYECLLELKHRTVLSTELVLPQKPINNNVSEVSNPSLEYVSLLSEGMRRD